MSLPDNFLAQQAPSLRSVRLSNVHPAFDHFFPLPNLTELDMNLLEGTKPFRMGVLLQFFSDSPLLQRIHIKILVDTVQDISPDHQVTSLDSLVEMNYSCKQASSILPFLRLPRLKKLFVSCSVGLGQVQKLADILPCDGHALLAQTPRIWYNSDPHPRPIVLTLCGDGVRVTFHAFRTTAETPVGGFVDWFSNQSAIQFSRVGELMIWDSPAVAGFHINVFALENLKILRTGRCDGQLAEEFLRPFRPVPGMGVPCRSLREIGYTYQRTDGPLPTSLISLSKERKRAGYELEHFLFAVAHESDRDLVEELREHVPEVQVTVWPART